MNPFLGPLWLVLLGWVWAIGCEVLYGRVSTAGKWPPTRAFAVRIAGWSGMAILVLVALLATLRTLVTRH